MDTNKTNMETKFERLKTKGEIKKTIVISQTIQNLKKIVIKRTNTKCEGKINCKDQFEIF